MTTPRTRAKRAPKGAQVEAADLRPLLVGSKVVLRGELCDGPTGEVVAVKDGEIRAVRFEGEQKPCDVECGMLRRLP